MQGLRKKPARFSLHTEWLPDREVKGCENSQKGFDCSHYPNQFYFQTKMICDILLALKRERLLYQSRIRPSRRFYFLIHTYPGGRRGEF